MTIKTALLIAAAALLVGPAAASAKTARNPYQAGMLIGACRPGSTTRLNLKSP